MVGCPYTYLYELYQYLVKTGFPIELGKPDVEYFVRNLELDVKYIQLRQDLIVKYKQKIELISSILDLIGY